MKHEETCRCGASLTVEDDQRADVLAAVEAWRTTHLCLPPGQPSRVDPQQTGSTCGIVGFTASQPPGWTTPNPIRSPW